ncbi:hypothetical protein [Aminipila terrae]|uniref:hypothetical protein n=1 Tax=Aminipila terrae TaxID=2697030 RepID=UPI001FAE3B0E|nr:hypothetical protein [Aminipila terrae]
MKLEKKLDGVMNHRDEALKIIPDNGKAGTIAIFNHHIYHLQAELKWLKEMERGL